MPNAPVVAALVAVSLDPADTVGRVELEVRRVRNRDHVPVRGSYADRSERRVGHRTNS